MAVLNLPERYNASTTFIDANLEAGRGNKTAILYGDQSLTYNDVAAMVNRTGNALIKLGVRMEERVMLLLLDSPEFVASFFGAIRMGAVPIPTNTLLRPADYEYLLNDSRATTLIVSEPLWANIEPIRANLKWLKHIIVVGASTGAHSSAAAQKNPPGTINFADWIKNESAELVPADTARDDVCFWLYSSGTTGFPKGAVHLQHDMIYCAENYARGVLNIQGTIAPSPPPNCFSPTAWATRSTFRSTSVPRRSCTLGARSRNRSTRSRRNSSRRFSSACRPRTLACSRLRTPPRTI
jgi:acyl-coenzyme A synthetase/AMP-(fatty) acid ligase